MWQLLPKTSASTARRILGPKTRPIAAPATAAEPLPVWPLDVSEEDSCERAIAGCAYPLLPCRESVHLLCGLLQAQSHFLADFIFFCFDLCYEILKNCLCADWGAFFLTWQNTIKFLI